MQHLLARPCEEICGVSIKNGTRDKREDISLAAMMLSHASRLFDLVCVLFPENSKVNSEYDPRFTDDQFGSGPIAKASSAQDKKPPSHRDRPDP